MARLSPVIVSLQSIQRKSPRRSIQQVASGCLGCALLAMAEPEIIVIGRKFVD
jgi:hypothetical protein